MPPLNPKRRVIRNRVLRRAVTRGVDTFYWGVGRKQKPKQEQKQNKTWGEDDALTIISFTLMMFLVGMILKSC